MRRVNGTLESLLYWGTAASAMLFLVVVLVGASRFVLHRPVLASIELSRLSFVWSCFLATALGAASARRETPRDCRAPVGPVATRGDPHRPST